jgi:hypothetical protein
MENKRIEKEFNSFKKKMIGSNLVWFESLNTKRKWDLFYEWKRVKYHKSKNLKSPVKVKRTLWDYTNNVPKDVSIMIYPASLKHFIKEARNSYKYKVEKETLRDKTIDMLFDTNKK